MKLKIFYTIMEALFLLIAPLVFVLVEYGSTQTGTPFKLGFGGILMLLLLVWIFKRTLLKNYLNTLREQIASYEGGLKVETDAGKITNLTRELKRAKTVDTLIGSITPLLVLCALLLLCNALERALVTLSGAVGFTIVSFVLGTVFSVLRARQVKSKDKGSKNQEMKKENK